MSFFRYVPQFQTHRNGLQLWPESAEDKNEFRVASKRTRSPRDPHANPDIFQETTVS